jgi:hypothetical protein
VFSLAKVNNELKSWDEENSRACGLYPSNLTNIFQRRLSSFKIPYVRTAYKLALAVRHLSLLPTLIGRFSFLVLVEDSFYIVLYPADILTALEWFLLFRHWA